MLTVILAQFSLVFCWLQYSPRKLTWNLKSSPQKVPGETRNIYIQCSKHLFCWLPAVEFFWGVKIDCSLLGPWYRIKVSGAPPSYSKTWRSDTMKSTRRWFQWYWRFSRSYQRSLDLFLHEVDFFFLRILPVN